LQEVEHDLIDAYVSGTLVGDELKQFESRYLTSPRRLQQVQFARSFLAAVDRAAMTHAGSGPGSAPAGSLEHAARGPAARAVRTPRFALAPRRLAAAAVLVIATGAIGLALFQAARLHEAPGRATSVAPASSPPPALAELATALVLLPQTRAVGPVPAAVIPAGADTMTFELQLESNDFPRYQVSLEDPAANQTEWRSDPLAPSTGGRAPTVSVVVPAGGLKPHHYSLTLAGLRGGTSEVVGSYTFQVVRR
jgi:hypothetical protein